MLQLEQIEQIKKRNSILKKPDEPVGLTVEEQAVFFIYEDLYDIKHKFVDIAFRLDEANKLEYYKKFGYESIVEFAEHLFGFKKSNTYSLISIANSFCDGMKLKPGYDKFSQSQLTEMCALPEYLRKNVKPEMTVQDIRDYKKAFGKLTFWNEDTLKQPKNIIEEYRKEKARLSGRLEKTAFNNNDIEQNKYSFTSRENVREFLKDNNHWKQGECYSPFFHMYYYKFKNGKILYSFYYRICSKNGPDNIYDVSNDFYITSTYTDVPVKITKEQIEKYILENKEEL